MTPIGWMGVVLQVAGLVLAGIGLADTWRQFGPGEPFLAPVWRLLAQVRAGILRARSELYRRIRRRPRDTVVGVGAAQLRIATFRARARVQFGRLAKHDAPAAIGELDQRTKILMDAIADLQERVADDADASSARLGAIDARLSSEVARLESVDREIAVGGVRLEALGLVIVAGGTMLQALWG